MSAKRLQKRRDFLKTAAAGAFGITAVRFNKIFASPKAWTKVQINPAIDNTRVICCHDTKMLTSTPNQTFASMNSAVNAAAVSSNLDQMAMLLTQKSTAADAWSAIFQKPAAKTWSNVRVAMKTNGIGTSSTNRPKAAIYKKLCDVLIDQLGVQASNIVLYDACDDASKYYTATYVSLTDSTKIRAVVSTRGSSMGGLSAVTLANWNTAEGTSSCAADLLEGNIDILINVAACKSHDGTGGHYNYGSCTLCMKNHFGTFTDSTRASHSDGLHVADSSASPPPTPLALFEINQHAAILGGTPVRQQLCIVDALLSNGASGPGGGFDNRTDRLVMGTFAPIVDYLSANNILLNKSVMTTAPIAALGVTNAAIILPQFLTSFGYAVTDVQNSWIEYVPGTGVVNPQSRDYQGRDVQVALSNPSYKRTVAQLTVPRAAGAMNVSILDGRGRLIRKLSAFSDETRIVWDGRGGNGTNVAAGNYFVKITSGTIERTGSILVSK
ncbi:MAG: FlgD immunoglobulin-like domain containing protein [Chitinivibrionales bacterium]